MSGSEIEELFPPYPPKFVCRAAYKMSKIGSMDNKIFFEKLSTKTITLALAIDLILKWCIATDTSPVETKPEHVVFNQDGSYYG